MVKICPNLPMSQKEDMIEFLSELKDLFTWSYEDMLGLDAVVVFHRLPLKPDCKPVRQKLRRMKPEWAVKMKKEVVKQYEAEFYEVVD